MTTADSVLYSSVPIGMVPANGFAYLNNTFGRGNLVNGVDYFTRLSALQNQFPDNSTITWNWSPTTTCTGCGDFAYGWPEISYGGSNFGNPYNAVGPWPEQLSALTTLKVTYDVTFGGNLNSYDTLLDTFLTASPTSTNGAFLWEVSFFPQSNNTQLMGVSHTFESFGLACVGLHGKQILIYPVTGSTSACTDPTTHRNIASATVDLHEIFTFLITRGFLTGAEYLRGYGFGPEMQIPAAFNSSPYEGSLAINQLSFEWE